MLKKGILFFVLYTAFVILCIIIVLGICGSILRAQTHTTTIRVTHIRDGDTFDGMICDSFPITVRLAGIDCPEKHQPYGMQAAWLLDSLIRDNNSVTVYWDNKDGYGRIIGTVHNKSDSLVNKELVKAGLAWCYTDYAKDNTQCPELEETARKARKGLWHDDRAIAPWDWRKMNK